VHPKEATGLLQQGQPEHEQNFWWTSLCFAVCWMDNSARVKLDYETVGCASKDLNNKILRLLATTRTTLLPSDPQKCSTIALSIAKNGTAQSPFEGQAWLS
jgi:hypothetical protein